MGGKAFKTRLACNVAVIILQLCTVDKGSVDNVLKCSRVKLKVKYVCITMRSLVMSSCSRDFLKMQLILTEVFIMFIITWIKSL